MARRRLADRIVHAITGPDLGVAAAELGERIHREHGVEVAVRELETLVESARRR